MYLEHVSEMDLALEGESSAFRPRDRDISAASLFEGELVLDLAGQASLGGNSNIKQEFFHQLQRIVDAENAELHAMETHLDNASGIILMLQESSQTDP